MVLTGRTKGAWGYIAAAGIDAVKPVLWALGAAAFLALLYWWGYLGPNESSADHQQPERQCEYAQGPHGAPGASTPRPDVIVCFKANSNSVADEANGSDGTSPKAPSPLSRYVARHILSEPITAFTLVLAFLTWRLIVVGRDQHTAAVAALVETRKAADAAKISADATALQASAMITMELPVVFLKDLTVHEVGGSDDREVVVRANPPTFFFWPTFVFANYGKSSAIGVGLHWGFHVGRELPEGRIIGNAEWQPAGTVIEPNGGAITFDDTTRIHLTADQQAAIENDGARLWIFGFVSFRDFMGKLHDRGFAGAWWAPGEGETSDRRAGFAEGGPSSYHGGS